MTTTDLERPGHRRRPGPGRPARRAAPDSPGHRPRVGPAGPAGEVDPNGLTPAADPRWVRPALIVLLAATAALYLWNLSASGYGNSFYAAAVQSGTKSWKALFFGSSDWGNSITVDKPPAALWVMALSGRIFGFSSWSMLAPEALEGVATVAVLYATVKRWFGPAAGLAAGALLALTPVAALMFRFNNPDALLVLLMVAAAYCTVRALEKGATRWLILAGTAIGFAFLAKMLQAFLVLPALGLVYLTCAPTTLRRRITGVLAGAGAIAISAGWWVAAVELWPKGSRPWVGGSNKNSELDLIFGYNGIGRLTGSGSGNGGGFSGATGWARLFNTTMGGEISWLLPAALIALAGGLWITRRAPRTDRTRAALILWGTWLIITAAVFSFGSGVIHSYYTVALAPAVAALVAIGGLTLWRAHDQVTARIILAVLIAASGLWDYRLLDRTPNWYPELRWIVLIAALAAATVLLTGRRMLARATAGVAVATVIALAAAPAAYAIDTAATPHTGSTPASGPSGQGGGMGGFGGATGSSTRTGGPTGTSTGTSTGRPSAAGTAPSGSSATTKSTTPSAGTRSAGTRPTGTGSSAGGGGGTATTSSALTALLKKSTGYTWAAATVGSMNSASYQLASGKAVMAIGGFTGSDPSPTLAQFQTYVAAHKIHYFIAAGTGGGGGQAGGSGTGSAIATWVAAHFKATTVGGQTVYDLTATASS